MEQFSLECHNKFASASVLNSDGVRCAARLENLRHFVIQLEVIKTEDNPDSPIHVS